MIRKILLPADESLHAEKTVHQAVELAKLTHAAVVVMHAYNPSMPIRRHGTFMLDELNKLLEEHAKQLVGKVAEQIRAEGLEVTALAVEGDPVEAILRVAEMEQPDLIVIGSHGDGGGVPGALLGSVAERVVRRSSVSVFVVT